MVSARAGARRSGLLLVTVGLAALVAAPLIGLVRASAAAGAGGIGEALTSSASLHALSGTLLVGLGTCLLSLPVGVGLALVTERARVPGRAALRAGILLGLLVPDYVGALGWNVVYGLSGYLDDALGVRIPGLLGPVGVVLVVSVTTVPLVYLVVAAALAGSSEPDLVRAARASGASSAAAVRTVTLPLLRAPLVAALALAFVTAVNNFAVPEVLGAPAGFSTMTTRIFSVLSLSASAHAFESLVVLALALVVLVALVVAPVDTVTGSLRAPVRTGMPSGGSLPGGSRPGPALAAAAWAYVGFSVLVPLAGIVLVALTPAIGASPLPAHWSLSNFRTALSGQGLTGLAHSLLLAVAAASILLALGLLVAVLDRQRGGGIGSIVTLTFAVPGSALAVGMLLAYGRWLSGSLLIVLLAYLAKLWSLAHRPIAAALDRLAADLPRAARASGARPATVVRTVSAPLLAPAGIAAWALVFISALHEVTISSLLYGPGSQTVAVAVFNLQQLGNLGATAALATMITVVPLLLAAPLPVFARWRRRRPRNHRGEQAPE
jgi:iron(III) transport system permease protein